ncbi:Hsp70 family protein [Nocardia sp. NPDC046473]|uniref:Hsp70 family protein n=1 Tax=Nocardia sp. NPDC046473 TaxID=3155733 RepID=UPI00340A552E
MTASATGVRTRPVVRSRRTAVTFDSAGGLRIGGIPQFSMAVTDFADLSCDPEPMIVGGRIWSPANLVAAVVNGLRDAERAASESGAVATYPATYSDKEVSLLRQALDLSGASDVALVPEPVAAAEWLENEHGPLEPGFVLVYDLGGTSLDVTVVRVGPDWENHPMVGKPVRSYDFGGRPLGAMIARYAHDAKPGATAPTSTLSMVDIDSLRTSHVHDTLDVVRAAVRSADLTLSDISSILVIGGASRPAEVARTLAELGRPLVVSADPGQTVAAGAALMAARTMALAASGGNQHAPRVAVFSSAAVVSAVAMSAVTVFGSPSVPSASPVLEHFPGLDAPTTDTLLYDSSADLASHRDAWVATPAGWTTSRTLAAAASMPRPSAYGLFITPASHATKLGPSVAESRLGSHNEPQLPGATTSHGGTYADPAYFINPLPFGQLIPQLGQPPAPGTPAQPAAPIAGIPAVPAPGSIPAAPPANSAPTVPDPVATAPAASTPATGGAVDTPTSSTGTSTGTTASEATGGSTSASTSSGGTAGTSTGGTSAGETSTGGSTSSGATTSGTTGGSANSSSSGSTSSGGSTSGGTSSGGSTSGGTSSGASAGGSTSGASTGGSSSSGATSGGSTSGGSTSGGSTSGGSTSGGSTSGGASSGGSSGGSTGGGAGAH